MTIDSKDPAEIAKFDAMADTWWDPDGAFRPLHMLNPCRLDYIVSQVAAEFGRDRSAARPLEGLRMIDVGCGGGLLAEPMARLGADVTGIDATASNIPIAMRHAEAQGLAIDYRAATAEQLASEEARFDVVLCLEVVEHVADPAAFMRSCAELLAPGGMMICSTLNRTAKSFGAAILGAEWIMGWLPRGTHDWNKFVKPDALCDMIRRAGLDPVDRTGMVFDPARWSWRLDDRDLSVNYLVTATANQG